MSSFEGLGIGDWGLVKEWIKIVCYLHISQGVCIFTICETHYT